MTGVSRVWQEQPSEMLQPRCEPQRLKPCTFVGLNGTAGSVRGNSCRPYGTRSGFPLFPGPTPWAITSRRFAAASYWVFGHRHSQDLVLTLTLEAMPFPNPLVSLSPWFVATRTLRGCILLGFRPPSFPRPGSHARTGSDALPKSTCELVVVLELQVFRKENRREK
jgi:hypothetical protein